MTNPTSHPYGWWLTGERKWISEDQAKNGTFHDGNKPLAIEDELSEANYHVHVKRIPELAKYYEEVWQYEEYDGDREILIECPVVESQREAFTVCPISNIIYRRIKQ